MDVAPTPASDGVVWSPAKSFWNSGMLIAALVLAPVTIAPDVVAVFLLSTYLSLLLGHSVGMHRRLIHRSYECHKGLERALVYIGVLVGVAGPFGVLRIHDHRDWAQRQRKCHDFFAHRRHPLVDLHWQLNCRFEYERPPGFRVEPEFALDPWYRFLEKTWMLHQVPIALVLYYLGGAPYVVWGVVVRVSVSVVGHWSITFLCHNPGAGHMESQGSLRTGVQPARFWVSDLW